MAGLVAFVGYAYHPLRSGLFDNTQYFVYLAHAFLQGRLYLVDSLSMVDDLSWYHGHFYLYWPPFPVVLLMPLVAVFGTAVSQPLVQWIIGSVNVALVSYLLLLLQQRGLARLTAAKRLWLTFFFAFGTVHAIEVPLGSVWEMSQIVAVFVALLSYLAPLAIRGSAAAPITGAFIGMGFLSRTSTLLASVGALWLLALKQKGASRWRWAWTLIAVGLPIAASALALGVYNAARFGNPLDIGYAYQLRAPFFEVLYQRYGPFNPIYVPTNLFYDFITIPHLALLGSQPQIDFSMGGSLFLMSPVFFLAVPGIVRSWRTIGWALLVSMLLGVLPMLFLMGTGYSQYGPRYTLDFVVPLLIATAIGASLVSTRLVAVLSIISAVIYGPGFLLGMYLVNRMSPPS